MKLRLGVLFVVIAAAFSFGQQSNRIPEVNASSLAGTKVHLPTDLSAGEAVLIVGFSHKSSEQTGKWTAAVKNLHGCHGAPLQWYELPVLADVPRLVRPMVLRSMRSGLPQNEIPHFVPTYESKDAWKSAVQFSRPDDAYIVLVDNSGTIQHLWHGEWSSDKELELKQAVAQGCSGQAGAQH